MKNYTLLFTAACSFVSLSGNAQQNAASTHPEPTTTTVVTTEDPSIITTYRAVSYSVEEKINMKFGASTSTYKVPDLSLVNTNDLGPNNSRTITPQYEKVTSLPQNQLVQAPAVVNKEPTVAPSSKAAPTAPAKPSMVSINILNTYERVLDKGYQSVVMLKKVADRDYFDGNLEGAAKWYGQLLALTTDLDAAYYYRYAQCLKAMHQDEKAQEMMVLFERKKG